VQVRRLAPSRAGGRASRLLLGCGIWELCGERGKWALALALGGIGGARKVNIGVWTDRESPILQVGSISSVLARN
jgi:hypothetical protein